jgi:hypothetical protein
MIDPLEPQARRGRSRWRRAAVSLLVAATVACGGSSPGNGPAGSSGASGGDGPAGPAPGGVWTWVDVAGTTCSDGSATGFGLSRGDEPDVVVFMDGGGACWDFTTCFFLRTAKAGPFQIAEFEARRAEFAGTFLDRDDPQNPFRGWTYVFVPYCTGDLHAGDREATYAPGFGLAARWAHRGRANVRADLARLVAELPSPRRLVISGASAGGFGSLLQYDAFRSAWPASATFLLDDSGPPLVGDALDPGLRAAWRSAWDLDPLLDEICAACRDDFSRIVPELAGRYPGDRMALLSSLQDQVIRSYFQLPAPAFEVAVRTMVHDRFDPLPSAHAFLVPGEDHALLAKPGAYAAAGVSLAAWLSEMIDGDPAWSSVGP